MLYLDISQCIKKTAAFSNCFSLQHRLYCWGREIFDDFADLLIRCVYPNLLLMRFYSVVYMPYFSAVCDIGSASFKYDMRRLSEILAFPRAWYRRSIARRLFLGDQTINLPGRILLLSTESLLVQEVNSSNCRSIYYLFTITYVTRYKYRNRNVL